MLNDYILPNTENTFYKWTSMLENRKEIGNRKIGKRPIVFYEHIFCCPFIGWFMIVLVWYDDGIPTCNNIINIHCSVFITMILDKWV